MVLKRALACAVLLLGCAPARTPAPQALHFAGTDGRDHALIEPSASYTLLEFFSAHCPCQAEHDARLRAIAARAAQVGIAFRVVDSEADAMFARDRAEAAARGYEFPILLDPEGQAARSLHAQYATFSLISKADGQIVYQGGIDSDRSRLHADATPFLADAVADLVLGRPVRRPSAEVLGCSLRLR